MDRIIRGTTPTIYIELSDVTDAGTFDSLKIIFRQCEEEIEKKENDIVIEENVISCTLTEEETFSLKAGVSVAVQVRAKKGETVSASDIIPVSVYPCLEEEDMADE